MNYSQLTKLISSWSLTLILFIAQFSSFAQSNESNRWVDSVYQKLSLEEKIAQLMIVRANQPDKPYNPEIEKWIEQYNIGGVTFFKGNPKSQVFQTNKWQQKARTPMLISIDAEWGLAMRLSETVSYPFQMTLGAVQNDSLIALMGAQIAEQSKRMGIHINFAPVIDVNNNAENPVIGVRSFGDTPSIVAGKGLLYAKALQENGVIPTAKHFPGHGDTRNDSHYTLPVINHSRSRLDSIELLPFKKLIAQGVEGIMTAHLHVPALDPTPNLPTSLSYKVVTEILKQELGFKGLIITDGLDMKGVTSVQPSGKIELMALQAGNDLLLLPANVPLAITSIKLALEKGEISMNRIEESCKKVLHFKYKAGLNAYRPAPIENLISDLNRSQYSQLVQDLFDNAVTVLRNTNNILPLKPETNWAVLTIGKTKSADSLLLKHLKKVKFFEIEKNADKEAVAKLKTSLKTYKNIVLNIKNTNILANKKFGITDVTIQLVQDLSKDKNLVLNLFASPYALDLFTVNDQIKGIIIAYQDRPETEKTVNQILTGVTTSKGKLPVNLKSGFEAGFGLQTSTGTIGFNPPAASPARATETAEINHTLFKKIDSVALLGIQKKAYPGCQIVAIHKGKVIYRKAFGQLTYEGNEKVTNQTIYDLASLTKMLATTLVTMKLYEDSLLYMSQTLGDFLPYLNKTDKGKLRIYDVLTHQSGLDGWIPFYQKTLIDGNLDLSIYHNASDPDHPYRVAENLYLSREYRYEIYAQIAGSKLKKKEYRYSDLGFIMLPLIAELLTNKAFDGYVYDNFYKPLKLDSICFQPLKKYPKSVIAPTENDQEFRKQLLQGDVHDPAAAMLGGISGHAGLFGTAGDVAQIMQMLLNKGTLNGTKIFEPGTVDYFTKTHFKDNRRGLGFDKPPLDPKESNRSMADSASAQSFGHTGFTGTFAWADPKNQLVVVFLSNRVYPDAKTNLLAKMGIRPIIHELFYQYVSQSGKK